MQLPWRAAPRAAVSGPLTVLVAFVAALLLSFVGAAAVLHADSAGSAAVGYQAGRLCPQTVPPVIDGNKVTVADANRILALARDSGRANGFPTLVGAVYSPVRQWDFNGPHPWSQFAYRDGARDNLKVLSGGGQDGLWVPKSIADDAGIKLGDRGLNGTLPPVTAIYADIAEPVPDYWCSEQQRVVPNPLATEGATAAPIWFPSLREFTEHMDSLSDNAAAVSARFPVERLPATTEEAAALVDRGKRMLDGVVGTLRAEEKARFVIAANYFAKPVEVARAASDTVWSAVLPLTVISLLVGLAGVGAVTVQWFQRRHAELRLLWARGAGPVALGWRAVLELALPLLVGAGAGLAAARLALPWYAPSSDLTDGTGALASAVAGGVFVAALVVVGAVAATRAHRAFQTGAARRSARAWRLVPWELITAVLAYLAWARRESTPTKLAFGQPLPETADAVGLAFPLLVVLTVALVTVRLARWGLRAAHRVRLWRVPAAQLALRRLAAAAGSVVGILLVGTLAVGTLTVGVGVADAQRAALDTKSGLFVGAESAALIPTRVGVSGQLPPALAAHSTLVGVLKTGQNINLVIDPATFTRSAWLGDRDPADTQAQLDVLGGTGGPVPALRVGRTPEATTTLPRLGQVKPVEQVGSFPLIGTGQGYVVSRAAVRDLKQVDVWQIWSNQPLDTLIRDLDAAGIHHLQSRSRDKALDGLPFLTVTWTFDFVTALGVVLAVVAAAALVLAVEVRRRQNALAGALATRMGLRQRTLVASHLTELGGLAGVSVAAGSAAGVVCAAVSAPLLDPSPWLRPVAGAPDLLPLVSTTTGVAAVVVALVCWTAVRSVTTARVGELIRG
ncbi:ABC transporter permease [Actinokineospora auranticolor]|uniref:Putative ABC transport system permease protein n=1 Tax=Actinokineospora auranticolor TaxID=155976 RepID=A0A2S6GCT5_9PSEU|nr:ABC transporter permease [Actinokineospora auranticolor]PPK62798.1 putative ABC transport system permease protein [Actinokineospora auranticolor]